MLMVLKSFTQMSKIMKIIKKIFLKGCKFDVIMHLRKIKFSSWLKFTELIVFKLRLLSLFTPVPFLASMFFSTYN